MEHEEGAVAIHAQDQAQEHDVARAEGEGLPGPVTPAQGDRLKLGTETPIAPTRPAPIRRKDADSLENIYTYHRPFGNQAERYENIRSIGRWFAQAVMANSPLSSRERSLALTKIQEAVQWANASIAINEQEPVTAVVPDPDEIGRQIERIAKACHEANRTYCQSLGDLSQPPWDDAPDWQKLSAMAGVRMILDHPETTPRQSHESWAAMKYADGWVWGASKDPVRKTHPCLLPYDALPETQRIKDVIFGAIVRSLGGL